MGKSYSMIPNKYVQMLPKEVIKYYKKSPFNLEANLNKETSYLLVNWK